MPRFVLRDYQEFLESMKELIFFLLMEAYNYNALIVLIIETIFFNFGFTSLFDLFMNLAFRKEGMMKFSSRFVKMDMYGQLSVKVCAPKNL